MAVRQAALVSDESALEACLRRCATQIDDLYLLPFMHYNRGQAKATCIKTGPRLRPRPKLRLRGRGRNQSQIITLIPVMYHLGLEEVISLRNSI